MTLFKFSRNCTQEDSLELELAPFLGVKVSSQLVYCIAFGERTPKSVHKAAIKKTVSFDGPHATTSNPKQFWDTASQSGMGKQLSVPARGHLRRLIGL